MAFIIKDIGPTGADFLTNTDWASDWAGLGNGQYHGRLIGNISDTTIYSSDAGTNVDVKITGDAAKADRRTITADGALRILEWNDSGVTTGVCTVEDLDLIGGGVATAGIANLNGWLTIECRRTRVTNVNGSGILRASNGDWATFILENMLVDNCQNGYSLQNGTTFTLKNDAAYKCIARGFDIGTSSPRVYNFFNCPSIGNNSGEDFRLVNGTGQRENHEGVSSDSTATDSDFEVVDNCVINKNDTSMPVFVDFAGNNFMKGESDFDSWGITGDGDNTPTLDLNGVTRINNTIGPLEFIPAAVVPGDALWPQRSRRIR